MKIKSKIKETKFSGSMVEPNPNKVCVTPEEIVSHSPSVSISDYKSMKKSRNDFRLKYHKEKEGYNILEKALKEVIREQLAIIANLKHSEDIWEVNFDAKVEDLEAATTTITALEKELKQNEESISHNKEKRTELNNAVWEEQQKYLKLQTAYDILLLTIKEGRI